MRFFTIGAVLGVFFSQISQAYADDIRVSAIMQRCNAPSECVLVTAECANPCANVPVNETYIPVLGRAYQNRCGAVLNQNMAQCTNNGDIEATCVHGRCTIEKAVAQHASAPYVSSADNMSTSMQDYSTIDDTDGNFTAYDLPQDVVRENAVGN